MFVRFVHLVRNCVPSLMKSRLERIIRTISLERKREEEEDRTIRMIRGIPRT